MAICCPEEEKDGCNSSNCSCREATTKGLKSDFPLVGGDTACCGEKPPAPHSPHERAGFRLWHFVDRFIDTATGPVPRVRDSLSRSDRLGTLGARMGFSRSNYRIAPGLYAIGKPEAQSPVLVTANYKLTFDTLRRNLAGVDAWILVVETHGINVWCAAGKGSFSAAEVATRVRATRLETIVSHRRLVLPQLSATGVSARQVKTLCGFEVCWGPVHAEDIGSFLEGGMRATPAMRRVTFTLNERVELIPIELNHLGKPTVYLVPFLFLLSGLGTGFFSIDAAMSRGLLALLAYILAAVAGTVLSPILLPWLPGRAFALKGAVIGVASGVLMSAAMVNRLDRLEMLALTLLIMAVSSYLAMNFTGSTPFTSPTGVEKEMRKAIPVQAASVLTALVLWVSAGFMAV